MKTVLEQTGRIEKHKHVIRTSPATKAIKRARIGQELNASVLRIRTQNKGCDQDIRIELEWILRTSSISEDAIEQIASYLEERLQTSQEISFTSHNVFTDNTPEERKLTKWLNVQLARSPNIEIDKYVVMKGDRRGKQYSYTARRI